MPVTLSTRWPMEQHWNGTTLPRRHISGTHDELPGYDFTEAMRQLCTDIVLRVPTFQHINLTSVLISITPSRNRKGYGLLARLTPMRFRNGATLQRRGRTLFQPQRYFVNGHEMLYILTFCVPRFWNQTLSEKLITIFHELYHISPAFDGDLRRHDGRYALHSHSKHAYDTHMAELVQDYLKMHPKLSQYDFLKYRTSELLQRHGSVTATSVPRPHMIPVKRPTSKPADSATLQTQTAQTEAPTRPAPKRPKRSAND